MSRRISWTTVVVIAILLVLGIGLPFWLEYRGMDRPARPLSSVRLDLW